MNTSVGISSIDSGFPFLILAITLDMHEFLIRDGSDRERSQSLPLADLYQTTLRSVATLSVPVHQSHAASPFCCRSRKAETAPSTAQQTRPNPACQPDAR